MTDLSHLDRRSLLRLGGLAAGGVGLGLAGPGVITPTRAAAAEVSVECDAGQNENPFLWKSAELQSHFGISPHMVGLPFVGQYEKLVTDLTARSGRSP